MPAVSKEWPEILAVHLHTHDVSLAARGMWAEWRGFIHRRLFEPKLDTSSLQVWSSKQMHIWSMRVGHLFSAEWEVKTCQDYILRCTHQIWKIWIIGSHSSSGIIGTQDQVVFIFFWGNMILLMVMGYLPYQQAQDFFHQQYSSEHLALKESMSQGCTYQILWSAAAWLTIQRV